MANYDYGAAWSVMEVPPATRQHARGRGGDVI